MCGAVRLEIDSIFEILPAGCPAWVACKEAEHEDADKKEFAAFLSIIGAGTSFLLD